MDTIVPDHQPGRVKRAPNFPATLKRAQAFAGERVHPAAIVSLVMKAGRAIPSAQARLLALLVEHSAAEGWAAGSPSSWVSNTTLADELGCSIRNVIALLGKLERAGWIVRTYSDANHRLRGAGFDLAPLGARLAELRQAEAAAKLARQAKRAEADDTAGKRTNLDSGRDESNVTHITKLHSPDSDLRSVPASENGVAATGSPYRAVPVQRHGPSELPASTRPSSRWFKPTTPAMPPGNLMAVVQLFDRCYPGFRDFLATPDTSDLGDIVTAASMIRQRLGIPFKDWSAALQRHHGLAAAALVIVAASAPEETLKRGRVAYARGLLRMAPDQVDPWRSIYTRSKAAAAKGSS
jgi:DNA-binding MarR family transcriptional regulator